MSKTTFAVIDSAIRGGGIISRHDTPEAAIEARYRATDPGDVAGPGLAYSNDGGETWYQYHVEFGATDIVVPSYHEGLDPRAICL